MAAKCIKVSFATLIDNYLLIKRPLFTTDKQIKHNNFAAKT